MKKTLVLYESKYGFTEMLAQQIALILGPAKRIRVSELNSQYNDYDLYVICLPIYAEKIDYKVLSNIEYNANWLKQKNVIILCTCLAVNNKDQYLKPLLDILDNNVILSDAVAGELILDKLSDSDYKRMKEFFSIAGLACKDYRLFNNEEFVNLILNIKRMKEPFINTTDDEKIFALCEDFIKKHNTCSIATGYGARVRSTPIEYIYMNGFIYILSEGGEKFANILLNPNVSISIFNEYQSMRRLAGMQITGNVELISIESDEYISIIKEKKLKYESIRLLPVTLNLLRININKIEFLWSDFQQMGYDVKQILNR